MKSQAPKTPKQMLRERRPERFSDSSAQFASRIDRSTLEYHLSTLTSRNQESDFQNFALKLTQLGICPNLRPQIYQKNLGSSTFEKAKAMTLYEPDNTWSPAQ
jgi:Protein of unknown function (DUF2950)